MSLSNCGRVVVIDDKWDEAENLVKSLAKLGVPCCYFDGSMANLPEKPLKGVRFLFLDIELGDTVGVDDKSKASALAARVVKIIGDSNSNGPYFIVFWTKHKEVISNVIEYLKTKAPPVSSIDLEKPLQDASEQEKSIMAITCKIEERLKDIGAFRLYVAWENILNFAGTKFVNDFSSLVPLDTRSVNGPQKWSEGTSALFHKLSEAYSGGNHSCTTENKFKNACTLLNQSFSDTLQRLTQTDLTLPSGFVLKDENLDEDVIPKINTALFIDNFSKNNFGTTGSIFFLDDEQLKIDLQKGLFKADKTPADIQLCAVIITPECDLANSKNFFRGINGADVICHRIIYGLCFPSDPNIKKKLLEKGKDAHFVVGPFWHEQISRTIIFHFGTLSQTHEISQKGTSAFSLRRDLVFDLQSKAANHVNRLGNFQLEIKKLK